MSADFNSEFKGFTEQSTLFQDVIRQFTKEDTYIHGTPERKGIWESAARASFESLVIYRDLIPRQACILMREPLTSLLHEHHSDESRAFLRALVDESSLTVRVAHTITQLSMMKPHNLDRLRQEVADWKSRPELAPADAPPHEVEPSSPRAGPKV